MAPQERLTRALPHIAASIGASNPDEDTLEDVVDMLLDPASDTRLWENEGGAAVSVFISSMELKLDEQIWHAGGDWAALAETLEQASDVCRGKGIDRIVIADTRKGWERLLKRHGFRAVQVLVKEL